MIVRQIQVGPMANFVYLAMDEVTKKALVVDSGWEIDPIVSAARSLGAKVAYVVASHGHFDHVSSIGDLATALGAEVVAHVESTVESDLKVKGGDSLAVGGKEVRVMHTPGHTEDSVCLYDGEEVFTGDTLFVGAIGRFERGNAQAIYRSLHEVLMALPGKTEMYPGHDYGDVPHRSMAEEKARNPFLQASDLRAFTSLFG